MEEGSGMIFRIVTGRTTWFDRDLGVAGRVMVKGSDGKIEGKLVKIDKPILRIPTLAIHLDRDSGAKLEFNKQSQLFPVLGTVIGEYILLF
jgi:aspartyl aminopeptidase